jgi:hypothetical protein
LVVLIRLGGWFRAGWVCCGLISSGPVCGVRGASRERWWWWKNFASVDLNRVAFLNFELCCFSDNDILPSFHQLNELFIALRIIRRLARILYSRCKIQRIILNRNYQKKQFNIQGELENTFKWVKVYFYFLNMKLWLF